MRAKTAGQCSNRRGRVILLVSLLALGIAAWGQERRDKVNAPLHDRAVPPEAKADSVRPWLGLPVRRVSVEGVALDRLRPLPDQLALAQGTPLRREFLAGSLRKLYATGLFENVDVEATSEQQGVALVFRGTPRTFIGTVTVDGAKGSTVNTQLQRASQLVPGARFTEAKLSQALEQMRHTLADNGFHAPVIAQTLTPHAEEQLVNIAFHVASGPQARVGAVEVAGDAGMSADEFRRHAHMRTGSHIVHDTANRALAGALKFYRGKQRLEAEIKLESELYSPDTGKANFRFSANRGPQVKVLVEGASIGPERVKRVIPIFEEGTVDDDLLNEGNRRLRDYYQRQGYFDVKVKHERKSTTADQVAILYRVKLGPRRHVERVLVEGNRYFDSATLKEMLNVHAADTLDRHGAYSQALVAADVSALQAVYHNNGFSKVRISPETSSVESTSKNPRDTTGYAAKTAPLIVTYRIDEGEQQRVGSVTLVGNEHVDAAALIPQLNTAAGQLLSPQNLAGDRDAILTSYLSRGFDQVRVDISQQAETADASKVDVIFHVAEGRQLFVRKVLLTGLHYTRPDTVAGPSPCIPATRSMRPPC